MHDGVKLSLGKAPFQGEGRPMDFYIIEYEKFIDNDYRVYIATKLCQMLV